MMSFRGAEGDEDSPSLVPLAPADADDLGQGDSSAWRPRSDTYDVIPRSPQATRNLSR
jgi:hypothetical protein